MTTDYDTQLTLLKAGLEAAIEAWEDNEVWNGRENKVQSVVSPLDNVDNKSGDQTVEDNQINRDEDVDDEMHEGGDDDDEWEDEDSMDEDDQEDDDDELEERDVEELREKRRPGIKQSLLDAQRRLIELVREVERERPDDLLRVTEEVDELLNRASLWANGNGSDWRPFTESHMRSYAHNQESSPLLQESLDENKFENRGMMAKMIPFFRKMHEKFPDFCRNFNDSELETEFPGPAPWKKTIRLHPFSSLCSRFKDMVPEWEETDHNQDATAVFQARCEIISGATSYPFDMSLSQDGSVLTYCSAGGWKNRTPYLSYFLPAEGPPHQEDFLEKRTIRLDLWDSLKSSLIDQERNLLFVGDWDRVKSYRYRPPHAPEGTKKGLPVHTMKSKEYSGPLGLLGDDRLLRAGKGSVAVWRLSELQTHGESGKDTIGERIAESDIETWRDDPHNIEPSTGSDISTTIILEGYNSFDKKRDGPQIFKWRNHPSQQGVMLCGMDDKTSNNFCHAYDFQAGGRIASRYLGHGGAIEEFSTIPVADPYLFLTRCTDGHARLYDVRHPLPIVTIAGASHLEPLTGAALAMPNGHRFVFTSTAHAEDIKVWDIRSRAVIYELATGNNAVEGLAWDHFTNSLYASTSCSHRGGGSGLLPSYRPARLLKQPAEGDDGMDEGKDEYVESQQRRWPTGAFHDENYFGHIFDCREHRMFRYTFKSDPNPSVLPFDGH